MEIALPILLFFVFCVIIYFLKCFKIDNIKKIIMPALFTVKLFGGLTVFFLYTYHYTDKSKADIYKYYEAGKVIHQVKEDIGFTNYIKLIVGISDNSSDLLEYKDDTDIWSREYTFGFYNDCRTIAKFNALLFLISDDNIFVHIVIMAFLSFIGCFALFKSFTKLLPTTNKYLLLVSCFLIPSCLIWTSGLLKEGLAMFSLGFLMYFFTKIYEKFKILDFLLFLLFCCALFLSKVYVLPALLPALLFMLVSKKMNIKQQFISFVALFCICGTFLIFSKNIINYDIIESVSLKRNIFINFAESENGGSNFVMNKINPENQIDFFKSIPEALINTFCRPFVKDINSPLIFFSFIEVFALFCLFMFSIFFFKKPDEKTFRFILISLIFIFIFYIIIGSITPNIGALVRYRVLALPFLTASIFSLFNYK